MPDRPLLEVADIIRRYADAYRRMRCGTIPIAEERVLRELAACRTSAMGGHLEVCDECGHERPAYNSCGNRHCPKCQGAARAAWLAARVEELLPVPYYHVVFTLPHHVAPLALQNKEIVHDLLFRAAAETLQQIAADPRHLGAELGFLAVLHTWGQNLLHHPHLHCVVPGGGLSPDASRWVATRSEAFFLPVRVLSRVFRGKFLDGLKRAYREGKLSFHGNLASLSQPEAFQRFLSEAYASAWVVYAKRPFGGPQQTLKYLARYTHRVAISNHRLVSMEDGRVTFRWKDYADGNREKPMTLEATEFLRRFLLHVLPQGFMRIRQYGLLANCQRQAKLTRCRQLIAEQAVEENAELPKEPPTPPPPTEQETSRDCCPKCRKGRMRVVQSLPRPTVQQLLDAPWRWNTS
jgi:hypothetical protein